MNQHDIQIISELSCDLIDRALNISSRSLLDKRSVDDVAGKQSVFSSTRFRPGSKKTDTLLKHHKAFFNIDDLEVQKRVKSKIDLPTFIRSVS